MRIGGLTFKDFARRAMDRLMTNGAMSAYSLVGRKGKESFKNLTVHQVLLGKSFMYFSYTSCLWLIFFLLQSALSYLY